MQRYSLTQRKKIAAIVAISVGGVLLAVLVLVYSRPSIVNRQGLSTRISNGYTTIIQSAQSYFTRK